MVFACVFVGNKIRNSIESIIMIMNPNLLLSSKKCFVRCMHHYAITMLKYPALSICSCLGLIYHRSRGVFYDFYTVGGILQSMFEYATK